MKRLKEDADLAPFVGKTLRISKNSLGHPELVYQGVLKGQSFMAVMATTPGKAVVPWVLDCGSNEIHFHHPGDGWVIHFMSEVS